MSYFLVSDDFDVQTRREDSEAIGLRFSRKMLDGNTPASARPTERDRVGTTIILHLKEERLLDFLLERYSFWVRDVPGLSAIVEPDGEEVPQGGLSRAVRPLSVERPEWIDATHIGPPTEFSVWDSFDGMAKVDVLYRGVHVDRLEVPQLWGLEGSIHVDPRHFRPKLNREGFVGGEFRNEVETFLRVVHPLALVEALATLKEDLRASDFAHWAMSRWVGLWLAVPRTPPYEEAARAWDAEFAVRPAFRLLGPGETDTEVSIDQLQTMSPSEIYIAPTNLGGSPPVVRQAVRALRARGATVIQGIARDTGYLTQASWAAPSTSDLLLAQFQAVLPPLRPVEPIAADLVRQESLFDLYQDPLVRIVGLGADAVPVVAVGQELWINLDVPAGRAIVLETVDRNEATVGLWIACLLHAPESVQEVAKVVRHPTTSPRFGPVLKQHVRKLRS